MINPYLSTPLSCQSLQWQYIKASCAVRMAALLSAVTVLVAEVLIKLLIIWSTVKWVEREVR